MAETTLVPLERRSQVDVRARGDAASRVASYLAVPALPGVNRFIATRAGDCYGLGPDEWLVVGSESSRTAIQEALDSAVGRDDGAAVDVSSSRILLELRGLAARDVLASCCALDLHPRVFGSGQCAQTLVAKAPVLLAQIDETPGFWIFVRPSLASYVVSWLADGIEGLRREE
jgi:sarcosine oxidase subunit gamma